MVAVIKTGTSLHNIFNYNENKVKQGAAECIGEGNYPLEVDKMSITMKLSRLLNQNTLNENVKRNSVHISLNFDPSETFLTNEKLMQIAHAYMQKIGFGEQPYLVYRHHDAGHPHIHLVSVKVKQDGSRIDMHNIGRNQSETARKEIEEMFSLVVAQGRQNNIDKVLKPIDLQKISYGKMQSKKAIAAVLNGVLSTYKYSSLSELNAVLQLYNVFADRGSEDSRIFKAEGIVYRILDSNGKPIGVPIKASDFYNKPTLKFLEQKFMSAGSGSVSMKNRIKNAVDLALLNKNISFSELGKLLEKEGINIISRKSAAGMIYGITYVDHTTKCVFNGSVLGRQYSAKAVQERCNLLGKTLQGSDKDINIKSKPELMGNKTNKDLFEISKTDGFDTALAKVLDVLTRMESAQAYLPNQLKAKRRKKKRKGQSDNQ